MELVKPVEPVLWASIVELVIGGTGYGTVEALAVGAGGSLWQSDGILPTRRNLVACLVPISRCWSCSLFLPPIPEKRRREWRHEL